MSNFYCIYNGFVLNGRRIDIAKDENFVNQLVRSYLRGGEEIFINGTKYRAGSETFQIFKMQTEWERQSDAEQYIHSMGFGTLDKNTLSRLFINVTDEFLYGRGYGDLKDDYFNIYINDSGKKPIITVLTKNEVVNFLREFANGNKTIWVSARTVNLDKPTSIKIIDIDYKWLEKDRGKIKEQINKMKNIYGKWSLDVLKCFGKDVTTDFEIMPFASSQSSNVNSSIAKDKTYQTTDSKIFISHSSKDEAIVKKFVDLILDNALGVNTSLIFCTSIEGLGIKSGQDFKQKIKTELLNSKIVLQIISKDYKSSEVCLNEMGAAWVLADDVIPLVIDNEYDVGFINRSNQQLKLSSKKDILQFIDDRDLLFPNKSSLAKIDRHIDEFLATLKIN